MSVINPPLYVEGGHHTGETLRGALQAAGRGNQGIGATGDLIVSAESTPAGSVQVAPGTATITGVAGVLQGSYWGRAPDVTTVPISPTAGVARSDMVVMRVLDPEYEGSATPDTDVLTIEVVSGVGSGATSVPSGMTAIPLARVDVPAATSAITDAMITDLRSLANPRTLRQLLTAAPTSANTLTTGAGGQIWPASGSWPVDIPEWAGNVIIIATWAQVLITDPCAGTLWAHLGSHITTQAVDYSSSGASGRMPLIAADQKSVPSSDRGVTETLNLMGNRTSGAGNANADGNSMIIIDLEWTEEVD